MSRRVLPPIPWDELPDTYRNLMRGLGHTKQTYEKIQQAEQLLRQANRSMRRRRGATKYSITYVSGPPDIIWKHPRYR